MGIQMNGNEKKNRCQIAMGGKDKSGLKELRRNFRETGRDGNRLNESEKVEKDEKSRRKMEKVKKTEKDGKGQNETENGKKRRKKI